MTQKETNEMLSEVFSRLRENETQTALLNEKMDTMNNAFKDHDNKEMSKFDKITSEIANFKRIGYIALGIFIALNDKVHSILERILG